MPAFMITLLLTKLRVLTVIILCAAMSHFSCPGRTQKELKAAVDQLQAQALQQVAALKRKAKIKA